MQICKCKVKVLIVVGIVVLFVGVQFGMGYFGPFLDINYQKKIEEKYKTKADWYLLTKLLSLNFPKKNAAYYLLLHRKNEQFFNYLRFIAGKEFFRDEADYAEDMLCKYGTAEDKKSYCDELSN